MNIQTLMYLQRANISAYLREESEEQKAYSDLFDSILAKHGADSPNDLPDDKKDDFFNEVEREWAKHPKNKKDDGENTNEEWDKEDDEEKDKKMKEGWGKKKKMKEEMDDEEEEEEEDEEDDEEEKKPFGEGWARSLAQTRRQMNEARMVPNNTETPLSYTASASGTRIPMAQTVGNNDIQPGGLGGEEGLPPDWVERTLRFFSPDVIDYIRDRIRDMNPSDAFDWWWKHFGHYGGPMNEARRMGPPGMLPLMPDTGGPTPPETPGSGQPGPINPTGAPWGPQQWGPDHPGNPANWPDGHFGGPGKRWFIPIGGPDVVWPDNWGEEDQPPYPPSYIPVHPEYGYPLPGAWEWNGDTWVWNEDGQGSPNEPMDQDPNDGWWPQWGPRPEDRTPPIDQYYGPIPGGYQTGPFDY